MINSRITVWIGLAVFFAMLFFGWQKMRDTVDSNAVKTFDVMVSHERDLLETRMEDYERVLRGTLGLFSASESVSRDEWHAYYQALQLELSLPGIQGLGYSVLFPKAELAEQEAQVRAEGYPEFSIYPQGDRERYSAIVYIEPFLARNLRAFGYDMYSEPVRRKAMDRAISSTLPSWSGKVKLVQELDNDIQPGFLVYLPVYKKGYPTRSQAERQQAIQGFVYSAFRAGDMMSQLFDYPDRQFEVQLYDQTVDKENLLYSTADITGAAKFTKRIDIEIGGANWVALFSSNERFESTQNYSLANLFLGAGLLVTLILLITLIIDGRQRAQLSSANLLLENRINESAMMAELTELLQSCGDVEEAFPIIASSMRALLPNLSGACYMINNSETLLIARCTWGDQVPPTQSFVPQNCWAVKRSLVHLSGEGAFAEVRCSHVQAPTEGLCAPLLSQGKLIGVLTFVTASVVGSVFTISKRERDLITSASEIVSLALANLVLRVSLRDQSMRDSLTGLYNRRFIDESLLRELDRARRNGTSLAIAMLDLDHFKSINDVYGHAVGDQVLKKVGALLGNFRVGYDIVARYGGEEFLLILTDISSDEVSTRLEQLRATIEAVRVETEEKVVDKVSISIGVALFPQMGDDREALLSLADQALYQAKGNGRNQVVFYTPESEADT